MAKRYTENGCDQCWSCQNMIGHSLDGNILPGIPDPDVVLLPLCRVTDRFMTRVYDRPCRRYEKEAAQDG